ncbi:MAG: lipoxygenase family protein, partial [Pseudomonadota bacterium]
MRICLPGEATSLQSAARQRALFTQREAYQWVHPPGQPPHCRGVPAGEEFSQRKERMMAVSLAESVADLALAFVCRLFSHNNKVDSFRRYYPIRKVPEVASRWREDEEFGRQRLDGINPMLITLAREIPENFPVTDELLKGVLPAHYSLQQLLAEQRLFLVDYHLLAGLQALLGRFCVAPICLFWLDDHQRLMPLA